MSCTMNSHPDKKYYVVADPLPLLPEELLHLGITCHKQQGTMIIPRNNRIDGLYYLKSGGVRVLRPSISGSRRVLFIVTSGHFFFEAHYFYAPEYFSLAEVIRDACIIFFPHAISQKLLEKNRSFRTKIFESLSCKALLMGTELMSGAYCNPQEHIINILRKLQGEYTHEGLEIRLTQDELAELAGLHRVSINRTLQRLSDSGRVKIMRGRIIVVSSEFNS